jgi:hypothetical protein
MIGMMISATRELTIEPNAAPMMTPDGKIDHVSAHRKFFELF